MNAYILVATDSKNKDHIVGLYRSKDKASKLCHKCASHQKEEPAYKEQYFDKEAMRKFIAAHDAWEEKCPIPDLKIYVNFAVLEMELE